MEISKEDELNKAEIKSASEFFTKHTKIRVK
jgi:hypothetical protein